MSLPESARSLPPDWRGSPEGISDGTPEGVPHGNAAGTEPRVSPSEGPAPDGSPADSTPKGPSKRNGEDPYDGVILPMDCLVCGSDQAQVVQPGYAHFGEASLDLVRCASCGLVHLHARPRWEQHARLLRSDEFFARGYSEGARERGYFELRDVWIDGFDQELEALEKEIGYVGRLLQWGGGGGFFAEAARRRGWQVQVAEANPVAADYAEVQFPLSVYRGTWQDAPFGEASFDLGVCHDTLPYSADPRGDLEGLRRCIRPGGHLSLRVPTYVQSGLHRSLQRAHKLLPQRWLGPELWAALKVEPGRSQGLPYRLHHFSPQVIETLLAESNLEVLQVTRDGPRPDYLFARQNLSWKERSAQILVRGAAALMRARVLPGTQTHWLVRRPMG